MNNRGQIRRSTTQDSPGIVLLPGELAYSYLTGKLYIGAAELGNSAIPISFSVSSPSLVPSNSITINIQ